MAFIMCKLTLIKKYLQNSELTILRPRKTLQAPVPAPKCSIIIYHRPLGCVIALTGHHIVRTSAVKFVALSLSRHLAGDSWLLAISYIFQYTKPLLAAGNDTPYSTRKATHYISLLYRPCSKSMEPGRNIYLSTYPPPTLRNFSPRFTRSIQIF
jgi:hypothetical protein